MSPTNTPDSDRSELIDSFGRRVTYLRLSITDRCNLRCLYCMSEDMTFLPRSQLLTLEEAERLCRCFGALGVTRFRITGGEPLVRRNALWLFERLGTLPGLEDLSLTTNGTELGRYAQPLKDAGVTRVNISLDSLRADRFKRLTRHGDIDKTLDGIQAAIRVGFQRIKLNAVILKDRNHDEVLDLTRFALDHGIDISFIEEMPLGAVGDHERAETFYPSDAIKAALEALYELVPTIESTGGPSKYYRIPGETSRIGFISPHSNNFCADCNRVRVTAEGRLLLCLGQEHSVDLRRSLRANPTNDERVKETIAQAMGLKPRGHSFELSGPPATQRHMNLTGG